MRARFTGLAMVIIALVYSIGATGIAFNVHFCRGEFHSIEIAYNLNSPACGCKKKQKDQSCCKDVTGHFSIENDHSAGTNSIIPSCNVSVCDVSHFAYTIINTQVREYAFNPENDPPDDSDLPIYLRVRNLRH